MAKRYEIHVRGKLPADVLEELGSLEARVEEPRTCLRGEVRDQAALHGVLVRLQNVGIELVEVRRIPDDLPEIEN